ncbi:hypothetical protein PINS_up009625 [Pythium insidiosum]|nr:hypothetical protein PINS_up009625 [Pythium insidiosum]
MSDNYVKGEGEQPAVKAIPVDVEAQAGQVTAGGIRVGAWDAEFCGCFNHLVPNCCMVTFLPCVSVAQIAQRISVLSYQTVLIVYFALWGCALFFSSVAWMAAGDSSVTWTTDSSGRVHVETSGGYWVSASVANSISWVLSVAAFIFIWQLRTKVRERFQIPGSCVEDFFLSLCCSCCTVAQMATHVKSYKPGSCDFGPPDTLPAYE